MPCVKAAIRTDQTINQMQCKNIVGGLGQVVLENPHLVQHKE